MATRAAPFDIGCRPSPSVPAETVVADGWKTCLLFFAVSERVGPSGTLDDLGVAVLDCSGCAASKFGYPNDEGEPEHPLYHCGLADSPASVFEVTGSPWLAEVEAQMAASARRIWGGRGVRPAPGRELRHFVVPLKEKTFECLAESISVERYCAGFAEAFAFVIGEMMKH